MNKIKNTVIIGLGLLGGSMALALKEKTKTIISGIDKNSEHQRVALKLSIIDRIITMEKIEQSDLVIIATPVNAIPEIAVEVLNRINNECIVFDVGSTKHRICKKIANHPNRGNYIAAHPIAGTEFSGPNAAFKELFNNKKNIVCDTKLTHPTILNRSLKLFSLLGMQTDFMESTAHDKHIAYVSHLSHISSFMLGKTVMEIEKDEKNIFNMAGSGFESTVRLAKSSPDTWTPIFMENKHSILQSLNEYIHNLQAFKTLIENNNTQEVHHTMKQINRIQKILNQ